MKRLLHLSFKTKILLYAVLVTLLSLIITGLGFISYDLQDTRKNLAESLNITSDLIETYSATALSLGNRDEVNEVIDKLSMNRFMQGVWIFDRNNKLFAAYDPHKLDENEILETYQQQGVYYSSDKIVVSNPISYGSKQLGTLIVMADLTGVKLRTTHQITVVVIMIVFSLLASVLLSNRLQDAITKPFNLLVQTVQEITEKNDYSIRAAKTTDDELGILTNAFNNMLHQIENSNKELKKSEQRLNLALWGSNEVMLDWDLKKDHLFFDDHITNMLGFEPNEMPCNQAEFIKMQHPRDRVIADEKLRQHLIGRNSFYEIETRIKSKSGEWRWILGRGKVVERDKTGKALRLTGTLVDITDRKDHEESLRLFKKVFESMTEGVIVTDPRLIIVEVNAAFTAITGFERQEAKGLPLDIFRSEKHDSEFYESIQKNIERTGSWQGELWQKRKTGELYLQRLNINAMHDEQKRLIHYVAVFSDISRWKKAEDELEYLVNYDALTNLPNRNRFMIHLSDLIEESKGHNGRLAVLTLGIDRFKIINDTFGHSVGDRLLRQIAKRLKRVLGHEQYLARLSGDEFALVIDNVRDHASIKGYAQEVLRTLSRSFSVDGHDILLGASIGISLFPQDSQDSQGLLVNSDVALFYAKQKGRNSYQFYDSKINEHVLERQKLEHSLRRALENNELMVCYQPKVEIRTHKIVGVEALIRWFHPKLGLICPDKFIPLAEETGLVVSIGLWVLKMACLQNKAWHAQGFPDMKVSVNLSAYQFRGGDLAEDIAKILWETELEPSGLDLELTESVLMENPERCILMLSVLKTMGISLTVDDFGTGYSSLNYLRRFQIDGLKIDKSFVNNVCHNAEDAAIIKAILSMSKGLQLKTVAEGVETKDQLDFLLENGCDEIQGYYFSQPLAVDDLTALLKSSNGILKSA
ncbi:MAG: EAL domain-containing protein [Gammaproteobacteria bacterium]